MVAVLNRLGNVPVLDGRRAVQGGDAGGYLQSGIVRAGGNTEAVNGHFEEAGGLHGERGCGDFALVGDADLHALDDFCGRFAGLRLHVAEPKRAQFDVHGVAVGVGLPPVRRDFLG